jgi:GntR family transcriptional repressor for pyruvate dehydrogenase complex
MMKDAVLNSFEEIVPTKPSDVIIEQIRSLISSGQLKPGERLPAERKLAEKLLVSRSAVRDAIKKLEFYGILKTHPQSGTIVAGIGITALQGLLSDILKIDGTNFESLVETRIILERNLVRFAAERRTDDNIARIENALEKYHEKLLLNQQTVEEDLMFHLEIAEASQNSVLKSLMMVIMPDIISSFVKLDVCGNDVILERYKEHKAILEAIKDKDPDLAESAILSHLKDIREFSISNKMNQK